MKDKELEYEFEILEHLEKDLGCPDCYLKGCKNEINKERERIYKVINKWFKDEGNDDEGKELIIYIKEDLKEEEK